MAGLLWMVAGAVVAALALATFVYVMSYFENPGVSPTEAIRRQQSQADFEMQQIVQQTITDMFNATRGYQ